MSTEAAQSLETARAQLEQAKANHQQAVDELSRADAAFLSDPTDRGSEAVLKARKNVEKAALFVQAREHALQEATSAALSAEQEDAREKLAFLLEDRRRNRRELADVLARFQELYSGLRNLITEADSIVRGDDVVHGMVIKEAKRAGIAPNQPARLDLDLFRVAVCLKLASKHEAPPAPKRELVSTELFQHALGSIPSSETFAKMRRRLNLSVQAFASLVGAEPGSWLLLLGPNAWGEVGHAHDLVTRAQSLLKSLEATDGR